MREQFSLVGIDGNIFSVIGYVREAMRKTKFSNDEITDFCNSVTKQKSYDDALGMCMLKVDECNNRLAQPKSESVKMEYEAFDTDEEIENFYEELCDKFVPACGKARTVGGEIVRAVCRIHYRFYNDGDFAGYGYGIETAGSACSYLSDVLCEDIDDIDDLLEKLTNITPEEHHKKEYTNVLYALEREIALYLKENPDVFEEENENDMFKYYPYNKGCSDFEERLHWDDDDWNDDDDDDWDNDDWNDNEDWGEEEDYDDWD